MPAFFVYIHYVSVINIVDN